MQKKEAEQHKPRKTYQFRIYPTHKQAQMLEQWLGFCCEVYNAALDERRSAYGIANVSLSYEQQCAELPGCKEVRPEISAVPSQVLQDVLKRVDLTFNAFFQRVREGQKAGYPRFKSHVRYNSLGFKQFGNSFDVKPASKKNRGTLTLAKLGQVKMVMHRAIIGIPKTAVVKRTPTGKWFVSISVVLAEEEISQVRQPLPKAAVGIDVGLNTFAYLSTGEEIANPRFFRAEEAALAKASRKLSKAHKGSKQRAHWRKVVARVHERVSHRRKNFIEQETSRLINRFGLIAVEALMVRSLIKVYDCPKCGLVLHRDHNGSLNILADGLQAVGRHSFVIPKAPVWEPWGVVTI